MRPKSFSYTFADLDADGFAVDVTGAINTTAWTTIAGSPDDGCAHQTTLYSTANLSGITITVTGTDAEGRTQSEAHAGPNNNTVNLTSYFKTVTSISASATLGANTMLCGWTTLCVTPAYPVNRLSGSGPVVSISPANCTLTVQQTASDMVNTANASVVWQDLIASGSSAAIGQGKDGITAVRANITVSSPGTLTMEMAQN